MNIYKYILLSTTIMASGLGFNSLAMESPNISQGEQVVEQGAEEGSDQNSLINMLPDEMLGEIASHMSASDRANTSQANKRFNQNFSPKIIVLPPPAKINWASKEKSIIINGDVLRGPNLIEHYQTENNNQHLINIKTILDQNLNAHGIDYSFVNLSKRDNYKNLFPLLQNMPSLTYLKIGIFQGLQAGIPLIKDLTQLRFLEFLYAHEWLWAFYGDYIDQVTPLLNITKLIMKRSEATIEVTLKLIPFLLPNLQELNLLGARDFGVKTIDESDFMPDIAQTPMNELRILNISETTINDVQLNDILKFMPALKMLEIKGCKNLTPNFIADLKRRSPEIDIISD